MILLPPRALLFPYAVNGPHFFSHCPPLYAVSFLRSFHKFQRNIRRCYSLLFLLLVLQASLVLVLPLACCCGFGAAIRPGPGIVDVRIYFPVHAFISLLTPKG